MSPVGPDRDYFRALLSQSGDKYVTSPPPPPIVELVRGTSSRRRRDYDVDETSLAYFLLCKASELLAYESGRVNPNYCLARRDLTCFRGIRR